VYLFKGEQHQVRMDHDPGKTIPVKDARSSPNDDPQVASTGNAGSQS